MVHFNRKFISETFLLFNHRLNALDRLTDMAPERSERQTMKPHFCEFSEPYTTEVEEIFNKTVKKSFLVPCSDLDESRSKRDMCEVFRYGFIFIRCLFIVNWCLTITAYLH